MYGCICRVRDLPAGADGSRVQVVVVKQFPIFEVSLLGTQRVWKLAGFAS